MRDLLGILGRALGWASGLAVLVFILAFLGPIIIGGPGAHQAPLAAFILAPVTFPLAFVITLLIQIRRALRLSIGGKFAYFVLLALFLIPTTHVVRFFSEMDFRSIDFKAYTRAERLKHIPPLTKDERLLLQSTHFNIRVGVVNPGSLPVYTRSFIDDLRKTGLFDDVAEFAQMDRADMIATGKKSFYSDKYGKIFTLQPPDGPGKEVRIEIYYTLGGLMGYGERKQYLDRLSVKLINTVQELSNRDQYEGGRREGTYTGHGTFVWANGARYEGDFVNGKRTGRGTNIWANGTQYEGEWQNDKPHGFGTKIWANGARYEGDFVNGKRTGHGMLIWANDAQYEGEWQNGKPHGFGTKRDASGRIFSGTWTNGCFRQGNRRTTIGTTALECGFE